jgi:hypothetical protein
VKSFATVLAAATVVLVAAATPPPTSAAASPVRVAHPAGAERGAPPSVGLLQAIRTGRHRGYDRLVLQFTGTNPPAHRIRYVDEVRADPSDRPVTLRGRAALHVVLEGATLDTAPREPDPSKAQRYRGPARVTPGLPLLKDVAVAGDFEGVLSFGVGLARPAGLRVLTLTGPARLVIDFRYAPPRRPVWPVTTFHQAWELQRAADQGHQPWLCAAASVVTTYAEAELGRRHPDVREFSSAVYQVSDAVGGTVVVTVIQPARREGACGIWAIAETAR